MLNLCSFFMFMFMFMFIFNSINFTYDNRNILLYLTNLRKSNLRLNKDFFYDQVFVFEEKETENYWLFLKFVQIID